jgi:hypothetical protein
MVKEVVQLERRCGWCDGHLSLGTRTFNWKETIRNNARIAHESSVAQRVNVGSSRSPPVVSGPENVPVVEKDFADFRILRFESCEMANDVPNQSRYGKEKSNQSNDIDASEGVQDTHRDCQ